MSMSIIHGGNSIVYFYFIFLLLPLQFEKTKNKNTWTEYLVTLCPFTKNIQLTKRIEVILRRKKELEALDLTSELKKTDEQVRKFVSYHLGCLII